MSEEYFDDVYLQLNIKEFEELKKKAFELANKDLHGEEPDKFLLFKNLNFDVTNEEFIDGKMNIGGQIIDFETKKELGYISFEVDMNLGRVNEIIQFYMKKLGKVKTIMEAVKNICIGLLD